MVVTEIFTLSPIALNVMVTYLLMNMLKITDPLQSAAVAREAALQNVIFTGILFFGTVCVTICVQEQQRATHNQRRTINQRLGLSSSVGAAISALLFITQSLGRQENVLSENNALKHSI